MARPVRIAACVVALYLLASGQQAAAQCIAMTSEDGTILRIEVGGRTQVVALQRGTPSKLDHCRAVLVEKGVACFVTPSPERPTCVRVAAGQRLDPAQLGDGSSSFDAIFGLLGRLRGERYASAGGKRAHDGEGLPGFPAGDILLLPGDLWIPTAYLGGEKVTDFFLENRTARQRYSGSVRPDGIVVPAAVLKADQQYRWVAQVAGRTYTGSFVPVAAADTAELRAALGAAGRAAELAGDPAALAVMRALILERHGFGFNAAQVLASFEGRGGGP